MKKHKFSAQWWLVAAVSTAVIAGASAGEVEEVKLPGTGLPALSPPAWAVDAVWYRVEVPRFRNGDPSNDPPRTLEWFAPDGAYPFMGHSHDEHGHHTDGEHKHAGGDHAHEHGDLGPFGGDLKGLMDKLAHIKELGANTLLLSEVFAYDDESTKLTVDYRHVEPTLGAGAQVTSESSLKPADWTINANDRALIALLEAAHAEGLRVVVGVRLGRVSPQHWAWKDVAQNGKGASAADWFAVQSWGPPVVSQHHVEKEHKHPGDARTHMHGVFFKQSAEGLAPAAKQHLLNVMARWTDPNGDGKFTDGVDGWHILDAPALPSAFCMELRGHVKKINPDVMLLAQGDARDPKPIHAVPFDAVLDGSAGAAVCRFFNSAGGEYPVTKFMADLTAAYNKYPPGLAVVSPVSISDPVGGRGLSAIAARPTTTAIRTHATNADIGRYRVVLAIQQFLPGTPMTYFGDEIGMYGRTGKDGLAPMWWNDLEALKTKTRNYRGDIYSLVQFLHLRRGVDKPLRGGGFRVVHVDEAAKVFAFGRPTASGEVVLVVNYGDQKQRIKLKLGEPGELVGMYLPRTAAPKRRRPGQSAPDHTVIKPMSMGGNRHFVDPNGEVTTVLSPMTFRVIVRSAEIPG